MPEINAYADVFRDWAGLLGACERNVDLLPGLDPFKLELETFRDRLNELKLDQEHLAGHRKATTQRLTRTLDGGREAARKLRSFVRSLLGTRDELLTQFGIPPNRSRKVARNQPEEQDHPGAQPAPGRSPGGGEPDPQPAQGHAGSTRRAASRPGSARAGGALEEGAIRRGRESGSPGDHPDR